MNSQNSDLNRREFLSTVTAAAGLLAMGLSPSASADEAASARAGAPRAWKRAGISDGAYQGAWSRAEALVKQMTLDEKISQLGSGAPGIERLGVPPYNYYTGEALHGLTRGAPVTSFPVPLALAACWNPDLFHTIYTAISDEARAYDNRDKIGLSYYSPPTLNLHRDPRWGRCAEAPGEDPCLASTLAVQVVRGMQGNDPNYLKTTACSKHYICNNTDADRMAISASVDSRSFWEYYTRAYRATIQDGDVFTVMGAYSAMNGIPCCASRFLLTDLLRDQWGFRGYVTSDCDAIYNIYDPHHYAASQPIAAAMAVLAGCDLNCGGTLQHHLKAAVNQELISEDDIALSVTRVFAARFLLGLFDPPDQVPYTRIPFDVVDSPAHRDLALEAARQSLVLLKNDSQFLPLDKAAIKKLAVIGPQAGACHLGNYSGGPAVRISPYEGIANYLGVKIYRPYVPATKMVAHGGEVRLVPFPAGESSLGVIRNNSWAEFPKMDFTDKTEFAARVSSNSNGGKIEVHLDRQDGPLACTLTVPHTGWMNWADVTAPLSGISGQHSVFLKFLGGSGSRFLFSVEHFQLNPVPPPPQAEPGRPQVIYSQGCSVTGPKDDKMFQDAVDAAKGADAVVLVCGVTQAVDREAMDRRDIGLTGAQPELIRAVFAANPKTVLVLSSNNTVSVQWEQQNLPAILCAICAGQSQGTAIAEVLFGDYNPSGKLPCTWYRSVDQLPDFHDYDIHKGRTYMYFGGDPLYPFGFGLSYTTFSLDQLKLTKATLGQGGTVSASVMVANTGQRAGTEVVQLYVVPPASPVPRPIKQLAGFQRVELHPGERKTVTFELPFTQAAFWYWDENKRRFVCQPGVAKILVGNSSAQLPLAAELTLKASDSNRSPRDITQTVAATTSLD